MNFLRAAIFSAAFSIALADSNSFLSSTAFTVDDFSGLIVRFDAVDLFTGFADVLAEAGFGVLVF